jgi:uncharacterized protein
VSAARLFSVLVGGVIRRPGLTLGIAVALGLGAVALALRLSPSAATSTFVSSSSPQYRATQRYYESFGEEPVEVVVRGDLQKLLLSSDIERLIGLEGCLSGNVPTRALSAEGGANGPCGQLARARTVKVVLGPGTFVNEAAEQIDAQLSAQTKHAETQAREAERLVSKEALAHGHSAEEAMTLGEQASSLTMARFREQVATLALRYGLTSKPSLSDPEFVSTLVFDSSKPAGTPKRRFAYLFPSPDAALISVRMRAGLSQAQRTRTIALIERAVAMPRWRLANGGTYLVTGQPAIVSDLTGSISHSIELLALAVLAAMAIVLALIFRGRPRLLPLLIAVLATALTFGALALVSSSLTVAQVAALPVLVGLAVDYAIQMQARVGEHLAANMDRRAAVREAARVGAPTIATAVGACAAATLALTLSPVPMVRGFGVLLAVGIAIAFACALALGSAALAAPGASIRARPAVHGRPATLALRATLARADARLAPAWRGARELVTDNLLTRGVSSIALGYAPRRPGRVLAIGLALAALGWTLDTQTQVQTNIEKLVPQDTASLRNLATLERLSGVGGELDLMVSGPSVTKPQTIEWMSAYESAMLARFGYDSEHGCGAARLCPAFSLPDLFQREGASTRLTRAEVRGLLTSIPPYFSQAVIAPDHRTATLAFGIKLMGLGEQQRLIETMRAHLHPPRGVRAQLVGLPVLAARSSAQISSTWRRLELLLAGLAAVALVLAIAFRGDIRRVLTPLAPIVLASGWSSLVLFALRIPLNPMSVTLGALVIAIATEFSVLLAERHRQERRAGHDVTSALRRTYAHTGAAVAASGVTAIAGFGVLVLSNIAMLRDFGLVTLVDLSVSLVGVLIALPAAIMLADKTARRAERERGGRLPLAGGRPRRMKGRAAGPVARVLRAARPRRDEHVTDTAGP